MAMPASGCIALRTCITGCACSSISCAVNGSVVGSCSLTSLSIASGFPRATAPYCMSEFYGYNPITPPPAADVVVDFGNALLITNDTFCCVMCVPVVTAGLTSGEVLTVCFSYGVDVGLNEYACIISKCNGIGAVTRINCTNTTGVGVFTIPNITSGCNLTLSIYVGDVSESGEAATMSVALNTTPAEFTSGSGTIERGVPYSCAIGIG